MKTVRKTILSFALLLLNSAVIFGADSSERTEETFDAPHGLKVSDAVKEVGEGIGRAADEIAKRSAAPYAPAKTD